MQERYRKFDVSALKALAADSVGAQRCVSMRKMAEGGSNRIFRLTMDNQKTVIARIPYPNHGSLLHEVASEVATMDFVSSSPTHDMTAEAETQTGSECSENPRASSAGMGCTVEQRCRHGIYLDGRSSWYSAPQDVGIIGSETQV